jgi:hypothetical protein
VGAIFGGIADSERQMERHPLVVVGHGGLVWVRVVRLGTLSLSHGGATRTRG